MSAAMLILTIFLHSERSIFKVIRVENHRKTRKSTTKYVDNYVDDVDRIMNIHQKAKNIYTNVFYHAAWTAACQLGHNCKIDMGERVYWAEADSRSDGES